MTSGHSAVGLLMAGRCRDAVKCVDSGGDAAPILVLDSRNIDIDILDTRYTGYHVRCDAPRPGQGKVLVPQYRNTQWSQSRGPAPHTWPQLDTAVFVS